MIQESAPEALAHVFRALGSTLSCAESCTGGLAGAAVTSVPGASDYFMGGLVAYSNAVKERLLGVPEEVLANEGAVSNGCAEAMARGAAALFSTECAFSITGIAGPSGGSAEKPVGMVCFGYAVKGFVASETLVFHGDRDSVRRQARDRALTRIAELALDRA